MRRLPPLPPWLQHLLARPAVATSLRWLGHAAYLGLLMATFICSGYLAFSLFVRSGVTAVPQLESLSEAEASELLGNTGLILRRLDDAGEFHADVPPGHVVRQDPPARTLVKRGSPVTVVLSLGTQVIRVPDVRGTTLQGAQARLTAAGLTLGRVLSVFHPSPPDTVVLQRPAAGERTAPAAPVDLLVCEGNLGDTYVMPDLVGRSFDEVERFFRQRGFRLGRVSYGRYPGASDGTIRQHFPEAGHPLRRQDAIALDVVRNSGGARR